MGQGSPTESGAVLLLFPPAESRGLQTARAVLGARERSERGETSAAILVCGCLYLTIAIL